MAEVVGMSLDEVLNAAKRLRANAASLDDLNVSLNNLRGPLEEAWQAEAGDAASARVDRLALKLKQMSENLISIAEWAEKTEVVFEDYNNRAASVFNGN